MKFVNNARLMVNKVQRARGVSCLLIDCLNVGDKLCQDEPDLVLRSLNKEEFCFFNRR